jgi:hypothetical protein
MTMFLTISKLGDRLHYALHLFPRVHCFALAAWFQLPISSTVYKILEALCMHIVQEYG